MAKNVAWGHMQPWLTHKKIATDKYFYDHFWLFFGNFMFIFHKTKVQTVILQCWPTLNLNWYKRYDTESKKKTKKTKKPKWFFLQNWKKKTEMEIFAFCVITFEQIRI